MSRHQSTLDWGRELIEQMEKQGTYVRTASLAGLAEEAGAPIKILMKSF